MALVSKVTEAYGEYKAALIELAAAEKKFNEQVAELQEALKPAQERYRKALADMNAATLEDK